MEYKLQKLIENLESISNVQHLDEANSIVVRLSNTIAAKINVVACSVNEPTRMVLPLNVSWLNMNPQSPYYLKILVRVSKDAPTSSGIAGYTYTWKEASLYSEVFVDQFYDDADAAYLNEASVIRDATTTRSGIVRLTVDPAPNTPSVAVAEGDPRLSDARTPLPHTHPLLPAYSLKTSTGEVVISTSTPPLAGYVLVATSPTTAHWAKLTKSQIDGLV